MLDALGLQHHALLVATIKHRVVGAELFDEAAVARTARVRHHDGVERPLLGAAAGHANLEAHGSPFWLLREEGAATPTLLARVNENFCGRKPPPPGSNPGKPPRIRPFFPSFETFFIMSAM